MGPYHDHSGNRHKVCVIKEMEETPSKFKGKLHPKNLEAEKERFFREGITPIFDMKDHADSLSKLTNRNCAKICYDHLEDAKRVLRTVKEKFGDGSKYVEKAFGKRIDHIKASHSIAKYLTENNLEEDITTYWTPELVSSAKMMWHGLNTRYNKPEARKFSLIIKNDPDNQYLREQGIKSLADHEIGTHYFRMYNEGFQPWYADKKVFGLRGRHSRELMATEEGLACIHTALNAHEKYLWFPALLYYTACRSEEMSFRDLFKHLEEFIMDSDQRWRLVMRVKRGLKNPDDPGGIGIDQCYFEGACDILRKVDKIDFSLLYCGKICTDEVKRVRRLARMDCLRLPHFVKDIEKYKKTLTQMAITNGLIAPKPPPERKHMDKPLRRPSSANPLSMKYGNAHRRLKDNNWVKTPSPPLFGHPTSSPLRKRNSNTSIVSSVSSVIPNVEHKGKRSISRHSTQEKSPKASYKVRLKKKGKKLSKRPSTSQNCLKRPKVSESTSRVEYFGSLQRTYED